jgi:hypothetical protein
VPIFASLSASMMEAPLGAGPAMVASGLAGWVIT